MKKPIIKISVLLLLITILVIGFLIYSEKIMVRIPVMVQKNPRITFMLGTVLYKEGSKQDLKWKKAKIGIVLKKDYQVKTERKSLVDISFHAKTAVRITANSLFKIDNLTVKKMIINIEKGALYGKFEKLFKTHELQVKTPTAIAAIRGTELGFKINRVRDKESKKRKLVLGDKEKRPLETTVYAITGITEITSESYKKQKVLLAYQRKVRLQEGNFPDNPEAIEKKELRVLRAHLNAIHTEPVLILTDKIHFKPGSAKILTSSYPELDKIVKILTDEGVTVRIEGHTDNKASAVYNQGLSVQRASAIRDYLIKKGFSRKKMLIKGYGESKPIADNNTVKGRAQNRRVEFIAID